MSKVVKNSLIVIAIAILVFVIIYFVYDLLKAKPTYSEQVQQSNLEGSNMGIDTDKLFENVSTSNEEKTIELAKKQWKSTEGVYFSNMAINSKGNYIVTVNDSKTSKTLAFYEIDVENEIVKEK